MTSVRRSLAFSLVERYLLIAIGLAGSMIIARLLTPEEIGIYSVSLAVIGIAQVLRDFGIGNYLIQERQLEEGHIRTAFGCSLLLGGSLALIIYSAAPFAAAFYADERMTVVVRISALNFLVIPFCTISLSLLRREMAFARLAMVAVIATVCGFVVTITLAYIGLGPNSMAIGAIVTNIATGIGAWFATSTRRMLLPSLSHWRNIVGFGTRSSAASIITTISMDINDLAVGRILGFTSVAMISRAQGLMNLFHRDMMSAIRNVAYPAFANAYRENQDLEAQHVHAVGLITAIAWPFYAFMALYALEILRVLFGPQWDQAAGLVPWFCLAGAAAATCNLTLPMLIARGRIDLATNAEFLIQPIRAAVLVAGVIYFQNIESFAILFAAVSTFAVPFIYYVKERCQPTDFRAMYEVLRKSLLVSVASMIFPIGVSYYMSHSSLLGAIGILALSALGCMVVWTLALFWVKHPLVNDPLVLRSLDMLMRKRKPRPCSDKS